MNEDDWNLLLWYATNCDRGIYGEDQEVTLMRFRQWLLENGIRHYTS